MPSNATSGEVAAGTLALLLFGLVVAVVFAVCLGVQFKDIDLALERVEAAVAVEAR